ncbi:hypothetical protein OB2597_05785 [Pseudooceanicola batsensis HTCC2597]|uniref:Uncharacterized protein n=1 Tax=Pseudooceanicola batsensis (strain ATCC BAA-863 / DSM 15984 / KCTC 12145 / HTCC2597) TaxID=252305 RepID=A3TSZ2_PSEBH|nr:hypothetical protein [Pseudooceanicola batsensis]EAQ04769.1 hypothetical protein OB2597_05785 [Pseudooceanicola batsensis HTCC2597]
MSERRGPLFLGRVSYRQRRLADAARLMPVLGAILMALPLLWPRAGEAGTPPTSVAMIYIFGVWTLLTVLAALLSHWLDPTFDAATREEPPAEAGDPARGD